MGVNVDTHVASLAAAFCGLLSFAGCSTTQGTSDAGTDATSDADVPCPTPAGSTFDLQGWWAMRVFVRLTMEEDPGANIHVCDEPPIAMATVTWLLKVEEPTTGDQIPFTFRTCALTLPSVTASFADCSLDELLVAYLHTGEALDASLSLVEYSGTLTVSESAGCMGASSDDLFVHIGIPADFDSAVPLPGWDPECAGTTAIQCVTGFSDNVLDTDSDGSPGATFWIETDPPGLVTGTALATLRHFPGMRASRLSDSLVTGELRPVLEYDFVGSDASMAGLVMDTPAVQRNLPDFIPIEEGSIFTMVRVDGLHGAVDLTGTDGDVQCSAVLETAGLFD